MGKRKRFKRKEVPKPKARWLAPTLIAGAVVIAALAGYLLLSPGGGVSGTSSQALKRGTAPPPQVETRKTLSPDLFVGRTARAYEVAQALPGVLDVMYCYCYCDREHGHKTLLTCFTETHAAT